MVGMLLTFALALAFLLVVLWLVSVLMGLAIARFGLPWQVRPVVVAFVGLVGLVWLVGLVPWIRGYRPW